MPTVLLRALKVLALALICYCLLGFLILPGVVQRIASQQLAQHALVPSQLERIEFNPFSLQLRAHGFRLGEAARPQVSLRQLDLDLQLESLWRGALILQEVRLNEPHVEVLLDKDGTLNLSRLFRPATEPKPATTTEEQPFPLRLQHLRMESGSIHFHDRRPSEAIEFTYQDLQLTLNNLSTLLEDNAELQLSASGPSGSQLQWQGDVSLVPLASRGSLSLKDAQLRSLWPYVRDAIPLDLQEGILNASTDYRFSLAEGTELTLDKLAVSLAPFAISTAGRPLLQLERLDISDSSLDLASKQLRLGQIRSQNLQAWVAREADGAIDWQKLLAPASAEQTAADETGDPAVEKPWQILLADAQLRDYHLHLTDRVPSSPVELQVGPLNLALKDFASSGERPFDLRLDTGLGRQGSLNAAGKVQLQPFSAELSVQTRAVDLRLAQAYMEPFVRLELRSGLLDSQLQITATQAEELALSVDGRAEVNQLHTLDTLRQRDFVKWPRLALEGIAYRHGKSLAIETVQLQQPYARFVINEDRSTNISELLVPQPQTASASSSNAAPLALRIGAIKIRDGSGHFADFSLRPAFATAVQELNGEIGTLDNRSKQPAKVDIKGKVDRYAPVSITGGLTPFDPLQTLDIATSFKHVELTTLTPYSGKFAGYRIRKGRLNLDLHYRINDGRLEARNQVVLEQLQLGERVDSPDAVDLPIRLAVALLQDSQGNIDIDLPVSGDLNDPQFSVMPIIWQTLRNLVVRTAKAPFNFIAGLAGAGDTDLSQVHFAAGDESLDDAAREALDLLAGALAERPGLRLEIEGSASLASDGPSLAQVRLEREFQSTYYRMLQRRGDSVPANEEMLEVPPGDKEILLEGIYRSRLNQQPPAEWAELDSEERHALMRSALLSSWADNQALARRLAQRRAAQIKQYLVEEGQLASERVYLMDVQLIDSENDGRIPTTLHLGAE